MKRRTWIGVTLGAVAIAGGLTWAFRPQAMAVDVTVAQVRDFRQWLVVDGMTRYDQRFIVGAPVQGVWEPRPLQEGDALDAGAVIGQMRPLVATLRDQRTRQELMAHRAASQARWEQAQAQFQAVQAQRGQAEAQWRRDEALAGTGFLSPAQLDLTRLALRRTSAEETSARQATQAAWEDLRQAEATLQSVATLADPQKAGALTAEALPVRLPQGAVILRVHQRSAMPVTPGLPLLEMGVPASVEVVADILTDDALALRQGLNARVGLLQPSLSADRASDWPAMLTRVEPSARTQVSALGVEEQRVTIHLRLKDATPALGDGWRVTVRLLTREAAQVLTVDSSAVFPMPSDPAGVPSTSDDAPRSWAVMRIEQGVARLRPVKVQARQADLAWISEGLQSGDRLVSFPPASLKPGDRVRERP